MYHPADPAASNDVKATLSPATEKMPTYKRIQQEVRVTAGFNPETSWIAHALSERGMTTRKAYTRQGNDGRKKPCPPSKRAAIETAIEKLLQV
jgi:hypothetical protein